MQYKIVDNCGYFFNLMDSGLLKNLTGVELFFEFLKPTLRELRKKIVFVGIS